MKFCFQGVDLQKPNLTCSWLPAARKLGSPNLFPVSVSRSLLLLLLLKVLSSSSAQEQSNRPWPGSNRNVISSRVVESRTHQVTVKENQLEYFFLSKKHSVRFFGTFAPRLSSPSQLSLLSYCSPEGGDGGNGDGDEHNGDNK